MKTTIYKIIEKYPLLFKKEDKKAIEHVNILLTEYAFSNDNLTENAQKFKYKMREIFYIWYKQHLDYLGICSDPDPVSLQYDKDHNYEINGQEGVCCGSE